MDEVGVVFRMKKCLLNVPDRVGEVNADDFEMNMVLLKTLICTRITDILGASDPD